MLLMSPYERARHRQTPALLLNFASALLLLLLWSRVACSDEVGTHWTPPPSDPKNIEGVWLPGGYPNGAQSAPAAPAPSTAGNPNSPPPEIGRLTASAAEGGPGGAGGPSAAPPGAAQEQVTGSTLECTPVQRLGGAGGGMSNLWLQDRHEIVVISEEDMDIARKIYLNGRHPAHVKPQPNGHSIGHWEGNTLVVDTVGFADKDGADSGQHVVERIHKDGNLLIDEAAVTVGGQTRQQTLRSSWRSDLHVSENVCEENYSRFHFENGQLIDQTQ